VRPHGEGQRELLEQPVPETPSRARWLLLVQHGAELAALAVAPCMCSWDTLYKILHQAH
jgi:hypothetical protein